MNIPAACFLHEEKCDRFECKVHQLAFFEGWKKWRRIEDPVKRKNEWKTEKNKRWKELCKIIGDNSGSGKVIYRRCNFMGKIGKAVGTKGIDLCGKVRGKCE